MPYPVTAKCNFDCVFCDRQWSAEEFVDPALVIRGAPRSELSGMRATLGGGEPTLHPRLPQLLSGLRSEGAGRFALRTNGAWASRRGPVSLLEKAGLTDVGLLFVSHAPAMFDRLTRRTGAFEAVMQGARNLDQAGIRIVLRVPLIKPTLSTIHDTLQAIPRLFPKLRRVELVHLDIDNPALQVHRDEINTLFPFGSDHPWPDVPPIVFDPGHGVALCWQSEMAQWQIAPDTPTASRHHPQPCERCFARPVCPGVLRGYAAVYGPDVVTPFVVEERGPDATTEPGAPNTAAGTAFEAVKGVTYERTLGRDRGASIASVRLRVAHRCNRRCNFCFIPHHEKSVQDYDIEASISAAIEAGAPELALTGGEPTLQQELPSYIRQAHAGGIPHVLLQTNAIRLADPDYCCQLVDAGLSNVVISLHAHNDDVLEQITSVPSTLPKVLRGIENLHAAGVQISVTHVINPLNYERVPEFVRFMVEDYAIRRFCLIFATPMTWQMANKELVVRYRDAAPYLMEAIDYCIDNNVIVDGLAQKCGVPHCIVRGQAKYLVDAVAIADANRTQDWMRVAACGPCALRHQCYGVRRLYAWLYGTDEFKPVIEPGTLAEDFEASRAVLPAGRPRTQRTDKPALLPEAGALIERVGGMLGLEEAAVSRALGQVQEHVLPLGDGLAQGLRARYGSQSWGSLEVAPTVSMASCREIALLRTIRSSALGLPLAGAHGAIAFSAPLDSLERGAIDEDQLEALVRQYLTDLSAALPAGARDYLTPHISAPWPVIERAEASTGGQGQVSLLRRTLRGELATMRMTSVDSSVCAARWALGRTGHTSGTLKYSVWGYGRAGRSFAELFESVAAPTSSAGRPSAVGTTMQYPMLVGCADSEHSWQDDRGLERKRITAFKEGGGVLPPVAGTEPEAVLYAPADLLLLSGQGAAFDVETAGRVRARVVVDLTGAIDGPTERAIEASGAQFIPSLIATSGPLVFGELERRGLAGMTVLAVRAAIDEHVEALLDSVARLRTRFALTMVEAVIGVGLERLVTAEQARGET